MKDIIEIYTDGAVSNNPGGKGGAAAIVLDYLDGIQENVGRHYEDTTNQRMELTGIILGLNTVLDRHAFFGNRFVLLMVNLYSDSAYAMRAFNEGWLSKWKTNGWQTAGKKPVANQDLWQKIDQILYECKKNNIDVNFYKVKGHSNNRYNNLADEIAVKCKFDDTPINNVINIEV